MKSALALAVLLSAAPAMAQLRHRRPVASAPDIRYGYDNNSGTGCRDYTCGSRCYDGHSGTDISVPVGTEVLASADGTVTATNDGCPNYGAAGNTCGGRCGNYVQLRHDDGAVTVFCHMQLNSLRVSRGERVRCGQVVGRSASSGNSTGPHLHFGWKRSASGASLDPFAGSCSNGPGVWTEQGTYPRSPGPACAMDAGVVMDAGAPDVLRTDAPRTDAPRTDAPRTDAGTTDLPRVNDGPSDIPEVVNADRSGDDVVRENDAAFEDVGEIGDGDDVAPDRQDPAGGCGCRAAAGTTRGGPWLALGLGVLAARRRRRARGIKPLLPGLALVLVSCALTVEGPGDPSLRTVDLAVGTSSVCRIDGTGQLWCWGANDWGQVRPDARTHVEALPRRYPGLDHVARIALALDHACVARTDGTVACWGANPRGQLGDGTTLNRYAPAPVPGIANIEEIAVSANASCAGDGNGRWWCWGLNEPAAAIRGHVASLVENAPAGAVSTPREATRLAGARGVSLGGLVGAAVREGRALRWGFRPVAQAARWTGPEIVPGLTEVAEVQAGYLTSCARRRDGGAWCWNAFNDAPVVVPGLDRAVALSGFENDYCARRDDGRVVCWSVTAMAGAPVSVGAVTVLDEAVGVARFAGSHRWTGCLVTSSGRVRCRGRNLWGQLGDGTAVTATEPVVVSGLDEVVQVSASCESGACVASQDASVCARRRDGTVWCWGGMDDEPPSSVRIDRSRPSPVAGVREALDLEVPCALTPGGIVCWDTTRWGRGVGADPTLATPLRRVEGIPGTAAEVRDLATARRGRCGCAVLASGTMHCWDHTNDTLRPAERITELREVREVSLTWNGACVRDARGEVRCKLLRDGEGCGLAGGWTLVPALRDSTALFTDGSLWCSRGAREGWRCTPNGFDEDGTAFALPVDRVADHTRLVAGSIRTCAVSAAGAVRCVGRNEYGALGTNLATADEASPLRDGVTSLCGTGPYGACAVRGGTVSCWGLNNDAELGIGTWNYDRGFTDVR